MSGNNDSSRLQTRYAGNITIEMIDDFLNPISKKKDVVSKVKFAPPPSTTSQSFMEPTTARHRVVKADERACIDKADFEYVQKNKRMYEKELRGACNLMAKTSMEDSFLAESVVNEDRSVVGSAMSQIGKVNWYFIKLMKKTWI